MLLQPPGRFESFRLIFLKLFLDQEKSLSLSSICSSGLEERFDLEALCEHNNGISSRRERERKRFDKNFFNGIERARKIVFGFYYSLCSTKIDVLDFAQILRKNLSNNLLVIVFLFSIIVLALIT